MHGGLRTLAVRVTLTISLRSAMNTPLTFYSPAQGMYKA